MFHNTPTFEKGMDLVMACIALIISRICAYKKVPYRQRCGVSIRYPQDISTTPNINIFKRSHEI